MANPALQSVLIEHVRAETAHQLEATLATVHPECLFEDHGAHQVFRGRAGAAQHYTQWWAAFDLLFSRGEHGSGRWTTDGHYIAEGEFSGRHIGHLGPLGADRQANQLPLLRLRELSRRPAGLRALLLRPGRRGRPSGGGRRRLARRFCVRASRGSARLKVR